MQFGQRFERYVNNSQESTLKFIAKKFGPQVKQFRVDFSRISKNIVLESLYLMPKLEILEFNGNFSYEEVTEENDYLVELPNLETIKIFDDDSGNPSKILNFLETPNIKRVKFFHYGVEDVESFLERYQANIKHLSLESFDENQLDVLEKLKNMCLEHLNMYVGNWGLAFWMSWRRDEDRLLSFLKLQAPYLNCLCLQRVCVSDEYLQTAIELMPNLETLILKDSDYSAISESVTNDLHKLTKLKKLVIDLADNYKRGEFKKVKTNYLKGLRLSFNENLEDLESFFPDLSEEFVRELADNVPNLKKLRMKTRSHRVIEYVMRYFRNLEELKIEYNTYKKGRTQKQLSLDEKVLLKLKHLYLENCQFRLNTKVARKLVNNFPNLEHLEIYSFVGLTARCIKILLRGMKRLKVLDLEYGQSSLISEEKLDELVLCYAKCVEKVQTPHEMVKYRHINWLPVE
jgi:Leucine-rich repeat (LRR) protein